VSALFCRKTTNHPGLRLIRHRLGHFRGILWIEAYTVCRDCGRWYYNRWATTRREIHSFREPARAVLVWNWKRLAREIREAAGVA
jgi:hypothetical protein